MQVLSKIEGKKHLTAVTLWLLFTFAAFGYFINKQLIEFDPKNSLSAIESHKLIEHLVEVSNTSPEQIANTVLHFSEPSCACNNVSQPHVDKISSQARQYNMNVLNISVELAQTIVPATPAVAVVGKNGELVYFGPYGEGIGCSSTAGFAETMLSNYQKGYVSSFIVNKALGCYCQSA